MDVCQAIVFEETLEFLGIWLALVAVLGLFSDEIPAPRPAVRRALSLWPVIWVLVLVHGTAIPRVELRYLARRIPVQFERGVQLHGYHIEQKDNRVILKLFPTAERNDYDELGYSVHLVDQVSGESLARLNQAADSQIGLLGSPGHAHLYRQILEVEIPPETSANRALWVALALWHGRFTEFEPLPVRDTKLQLLSDSQFVLDEMILPDLPETRDGLPVATFESGFTLQSFDMPDRAQPGETLGIKFSWHAEEPGNDDLIQFLHLGHEESGNWWVYDQQPLGAPSANATMVQRSCRQRDVERTAPHRPGARAICCLHRIVSNAGSGKDPGQRRGWKFLSRWPHPAGHNNHRVRN